MPGLSAMRRLEHEPTRAIVCLHGHAFQLCRSCHGAVGRAAKPKLESLLKNVKDPEVVYRIERLLTALSLQGPQVPQPNGQ